ncbi:response regulator [Mariniblastus sp.]|nr:response regulator [Mariniblastus sp.]
MSTVLIVDDTAVDRRLAGGLLARNPNIQICYAENGVEALEVIEFRMPDLVVTDLQMPELDGLGLVTAIGKDYPEVPVILMTAHGSENVAAQALANGAASFVPKSELANSLLETVMQILVMAESDSRYRKLISCTTKTDFEFELPNDPSLIEPLIDLVRQVAVSQGFVPQNNRVQMAVALEQAIVNAMVRGNLELSQDEMPVINPEMVAQRIGEEPYSGRTVYFRSLVTREKAEFTLRDQGAGFAWESIPDAHHPDSFREGAGKGLVLIKTFMDEVEFNESGNEIKMTKFCDAGT